MNKISSKTTHQSHQSHRTWRILGGLTALASGLASAGMTYLFNEWVSRLEALAKQG